MDTSEQRITMCEKAVEIQGANIKHIQRQGGLPVNVPFYDYNGECYINKDNLAIIWLPTQDQLQEMIGKKDDDGADLLFKFYWWFQDAKTDDIFLESWVGMSMDQLWLAFVMKENYNKIWDGDKWIQVNTN